MRTIRILAIVSRSQPRRPAKPAFPGTPPSKGIVLARCETNHPTEEYELPALEAVLAGTLALMTGCAQARCPAQRRQMMDRIVGNMALLGDHPQLSAPFRCAVGKLRCHWELLLEDGPEAGGRGSLRHDAPAKLQ